MKKLIYLFPAALCLAAACTSPQSDEAKITEPKKEALSASGEKYMVDASSSRIEWIGTKVSGYHTGTVNIKSGEITAANGTVTAGNFVIDMPTVVATGPPRVGEAGNQKLTGHLRSGDFFDVQKFPEATFVITDVKTFSGAVVSEPDDPRQEKLREYRVTDPTHTVSGNLTIRGITKNIEFPARITINNDNAEAVAKFNIDRRNWGIIYPGEPDDLIRDEIHLGIYLKAAKQGDSIGLNK